MTFSGKCPDCGQDLSDVRFCTKCGKEFSEDRMEKPNPTVKKKKSKSGIILAILLVVVVLGFVGYQSYEKKINTPQYVIKKVLSTWKDGKYDKLYSYLDASKLDTKEFLSKEDFVKAMENNKLGEYSLEISEEDLSHLSNVHYKVSMVINGKSIAENFILENKVTSNNKKPRWHVDPTMFLREVSVVVPNYMETRINNKKVTPGEGEFSKNIVVFKGAALKAEYVDRIVKPNAKDLVALEDLQEISPELLKVQPTDEARNKIIALIKDYVVFNNDFNAETSKNKMGKIFNENSIAWEGHSYFFDDYTGEPIRILKSELVNISFAEEWIGVGVNQADELSPGNTYGVQYKLILDKNKNFKIDNIE